MWTTQLPWMKLLITVTSCDELLWEKINIQRVWEFFILCCLSAFEESKCHNENLKNKKVLTKIYTFTFQKLKDNKIQFSFLLYTRYFCGILHQQTINI